MPVVNDKERDRPILQIQFLDKALIMLTARLHALNYLYSLYENYTRGFDIACKKGCSACCTQHVTATTLEAMRIIRLVEMHGASNSLVRLTHLADSDRFLPAVTTNEYAAYCLRGEDPPEEKSSSAQTVCAFLKNNVCTIYDARPFGCRCFFSTVRCTQDSCAVIDPVLLTVNTLFVQCIEQVDQHGWFGNMIDVIALAVTLTHRDSTPIYATLRQRGVIPRQEPGGSLCRNRSIPALMIPPEHREQIVPIVRELRHIMKTVK